MKFTKENIKGRVLHVSHHFKRDENIMRIVWWDGSGIRTNEVMENYTTEFYYTKVDATPENFEASENFRKEHRAKIDKLNKEMEEKTIKKGVIVEVVKGKAKGMKGEVYAVYENEYDCESPVLYFKNQEGEKTRTYLKNIKDCDAWEYGSRKLHYFY